ncbi:hypothetical protein, partial [Bacteroides sp. An269]|uniref:hypothetical protein n=1 Tax=Bacteroides sp. An269 TaxID=1965613 RepID=UPI000B562672
ACILFNSLITKLMKTFNKIKKFSGYLDYNIEETVLKKNQPEFCILQIFDPPLQRNYERKRFVILIGGQIICRIR